MIKYLNFRPFVNDADGKPYVECTGLSTDTKPNEVSLNSLFLELDTKTLYYCSKSGGESEETMYEGEAEITGKGFILPSFTPSDSIIVTFDGVRYECEAREDEGAYYYGAPYDGDADSFDYSTYPFNISYYREAIVVCKDEGTHSLSISSLVTTEAEWTKYGEQGSGSGDMINVYFLDGDNLLTDLTTQMTRDSSITLPNVPDEIDAGKWGLMKSLNPSPFSTPYNGGSTFTLPENADEYIFTEDVMYMTAPYIKFTKYSGGLS